MNADIASALERDKTIDITTIGRKSGEPRRIEIWFHNLGGKLYITGQPGKRDWYANMLAEPQFTFHLKESVQADLPATARQVSDQAERRSIIQMIYGESRPPEDIDDRVARSPLVEVLLSE